MLERSSFGLCSTFQRQPEKVVPEARHWAAYKSRSLIRGCRQSTARRVAERNGFEVNKGRRISLFDTDEWREFEAGYKGLFEPFYTTKEKGTGLGMAIAKQIAELHSGDLLIVSRIGKGTTAPVRLPITKFVEADNRISTMQRLSV